MSVRTAALAGTLFVALPADTVVAQMSYLQLDCGEEWSPKNLASLKNGGATALVDLLLERASTDCFDRCALSAERALAEMGRHGAEALLNRLDRSEQACGFLRVGLGQIGAAAFEPILLALLDVDRPTAVQGEALLALVDAIGVEQGAYRTIVTPPLVSSFAERLHSEDAVLRQQAATVLLLFAEGDAVLDEMQSQLRKGQCPDPALVASFQLPCGLRNPPLVQLRPAKAILSQVTLRRDCPASRQAAEDALAEFSRWCSGL